MKMEYDNAHDLLNLEFLADVSIHVSIEIDGVVIDYAKDRRIVAMELLDAGKRTPGKPLDLINLASSRRDRIPCSKAREIPQQTKENLNLQDAKHE
jgi:uncharacterized protein YuzE